ncbi:MAG TPA: response regulator [Labilithrix sp.]|jgi:CheY-like chemotaxis protein
MGPLVLVVDDYEDNREIYAAFLAHKGYRVMTASDGQDALAILDEHVPAIVLMDLAMPRLDGWETTRRIKADARLRGVPVVAITGHALGEPLYRAEHAGADAVLTKPATPEEVLATVERLLAR